MNSAIQIMGLEKFCRIYNIIRYHGGLGNLLKQLYRVNDGKRGEWIQQADSSSSCDLNGLGSSRLAICNSGEKCDMMPARLLSWLNYITKDYFVVVPAKQMTSCDQDLQLHHLLPSLNYWDLFSVFFPPRTIEMTPLFTLETVNGDSTHYHLAITKNNNEGTTNSVSSLKFSNTASDAMSHSSLRDVLESKKSTKPCEAEYSASCSMKAGTVGNIKHTDCSSELLSENKELCKPRSRNAEKSTVCDEGMSESKLQDLATAMGMCGEEYVSAAENVSGIFATSNSSMYRCDAAGSSCGGSSCGGGDSKKGSCSSGGDSDCKPKKKTAGQCKTTAEKDEGCEKKHTAGQCKKTAEKGEGCVKKLSAEKNEGCGIKLENLASETSKPNDNCGDCLEEGTCHPNFHKKSDSPCDKGHEQKDDCCIDTQDSAARARSKDDFNKKVKSVRLLYKIEYCRKNKVTWGRNDFNKKNPDCNDN